MMATKSFLLTILIMTFVMVATSCSNLAEQIVDDSGAAMALVPAGEFSVSSRDPLSGLSTVQTTYLDDFYLDIYEVTNQRYAECVDEGVCAEPENINYFADPANLDHPVQFVTWGMAQAYCEWRGARLPSKAEWEKGASEELEALEYYWGDESPICQVGARLGVGIDENANFDTGTEPVGSYEPNRYGLFDMTGNVWEWVEDRYVEGDYHTSPDTVSFLRMSRWSGYGPLFSRFVCGFRCARSP